MQLKASVTSPNNSTDGSLDHGGPHQCPYCTYSSVHETRLHAHVQTQHSVSSRPPPPSTRCTCPLCQEKFSERPRLESHLMQVHSVTREGVTKLMPLVVDTVESPTPPPPPPPPLHAPLAVSPALSQRRTGPATTTTTTTTPPPVQSPTSDDAGDPMAEMIETQALKLAEEGNFIFDVLCFCAQWLL